MLAEHSTDGGRSSSALLSTTGSADLNVRVWEAEMRRNNELDPVVVGFDGSISARDAVDWASAEAAVQARPLCILYACPPPMTPSPYASTAGLVPGDTTSSLLREATERARAVAPDVEVIGRVAFGGPAPALISQVADLIVVGSRGLGRVRSALAGSVSIAVSARAPCPVVVVHPLHDLPPGPSRARVVVGVGGSDLSASAIAFAFRAAAQRGIGLTAVHAWTSRPPADCGGVGDDWLAARADARLRLERALAPWSDHFTRVDVRLTLAHDLPSPALVAESAGAALVVVGSRGRGCITGILFGSTSHAVVHGAHCPVAVVRPTATSRYRFPAT